MTDTPAGSVLGSGLVKLSPERIDALPEGSAHFRLRSSGQRVMYVGAAAEEGLREAVRSLVAGQPVAGLATLEYDVALSAEAARDAAAADIALLKPLYNEGFGRYRHSDSHLPKKGRRVRTAMHNP